MSDPRRRRRALWSGVSIATIAAIVALVLTFAGGGSAAPTAVPTIITKPAISGNAKDGQQLTSDNGSWTNSPDNFDFQWERCDSGGGSCNNVGSNSKKYTLTSSDVGHRMRVKVTAHAGADTSLPSESDPTDVVTAVKPTNTAIPTISGTAQDNQTLTADPGTWTGTPPIKFKYQWLRCDSNGANCVNNGGQSQSYTVVSADVGRRLRVQVGASNDATSGSADVTEKSDATNVVTSSSGGSSSAPVNTSVPTISGTAQDGQTLAATAGAWSNSPTSFTYQWLRCDQNGNNCVNISGATSSTYRATSADVNRRLRVAVTAKNASGQNTATSASTNVVTAQGTTTTTTTTTTTGTTTTAPTPGKVIPVTSVVPPNRLVVSSTRWFPKTIGAVGQQLTARIRVIDANGNSVSGALVYATGVPFNRVSIPPETFTDASGWATLTFIVGRNMPIKKGALLQVFVRTRKQGEDILGGVSSRRLISVRVVPT